MGVKFFQGKPRDLTKERMEKLLPIAKEVVRIIAGNNLPMGDNKDLDIKRYDSVSKDVLQYMLDNEVKFSDKEFLFQLVLQPFDLVKETIFLSLKNNLDSAMNKVLKKDFREITLKDIDVILKNK